MIAARRFPRESFDGKKHLFERRTHQERGAHSITTVPSARDFTPSYYPDLGLARFGVCGTCGMQGDHRAAFAPSEKLWFTCATSRSSDASFERNARGSLAHKPQERTHTRHVQHTQSQDSEIGHSLPQRTRAKTQIRRRRCVRPYYGHRT